MIKALKKKYDKESDVLWVVMKTGPAFYSEEIAPGIRIEFGKGSEIIGIEILNYSRLESQNSSDIKYEITSSLTDIQIESRRVTFQNNNTAPVSN